MIISLQIAAGLLWASGLVYSLYVGAYGTAASLVGVYLVLVLMSAYDMYKQEKQRTQRLEALNNRVFPRAALDDINAREAARVVFGSK